MNSASNKYLIPIKIIPWFFWTSMLIIGLKMYAIAWQY